MLSWSNHKLISLPLWPWVVLVATLLSRAGVADRVALGLRNGDRISGQVIAETAETITLKTPFSDKLEIPKSLVAHRETLPSTPEATNAPPTVAAATSAPVQATGVASGLTPTNKPPAHATAASPAKPPEPTLLHRFLSEWRGEIQLGANLGFSTLDREAFTGHMNLTEIHRFAGGDTGLRNILDYDVAFGTTGDVLSDNRMEGSVKTEYDFSKRVLIYNAITAGYDEVRNIDLEYDFGPGLGYKWVVLTNFVFKTELGADYQEQYFSPPNHTSRISMRMAEDLWWQLSPKIRWDEKLEFFPELDNTEVYRLRLETNLSYLLRENLTLSLNLIDQYDTGVPSDVSKNDLQIRSLLGIKF